MRKPLIAGNWKMNLLNSRVATYFSTLQEELRKDDKFTKGSLDVLLAVPAPFLITASHCVEAPQLHVASQTVAEQLEGAFTGEVSVPMLKDLGIHWTLVGHSERRQFFHETDQSVAAKARLCVSQGITPIVCVGETREERESGLMRDVLARQVKAVLEVLEDDLRLVFAYEPVWAIGTGLTASEQQAQEAHAFIRYLIREHSPMQSEQIRILYGGSVKSTNIRGLMNQVDVDGALVGGASLDPREFAKIVSNSGS